MARNLKVLGLALVAALAMSSVAANMASADVINTEGTSVELSGEQVGTDVFKVHGGEVKCTTVTYSGTLAASGGTTVTVTPHYTGCKFLGLATAIDMNGCDYLVHVSATAGDTSGTVDIVCTGSNEITVTAPSVGTAKCIVHVPAQVGLGTGKGTNIGVGPTREIELDIHLEKIKYSQTKGTAETGNCETKDATVDGTYVGVARITAKKAGTHVPLFLS